MPPSAIRIVVVVVVIVGILVGWGSGVFAKSIEATVMTPFEETFEISRADRDAGLRFAPSVKQADRDWFLAAIASARPEAQRLVAEVDGLVEVRMHRGDPFGVTIGTDEGFIIAVDVASLDRDRVQDRNVTVLHELGHVIDHALVPADLNRTLDDGIPRSACTSPTEMIGGCTAPEERFADTFAKWALRGAVSQAGAGYAIPSPASLEDWGAPLGALAIDVATRG